MGTAPSRFVEQLLAELNPKDAEFATKAVDRILSAGGQWGATDIHLQPTAAGLQLLVRLDGVLHHAGLFPPQAAANLVGRLKVLANLLTYRTDVPQEGRLRAAGLEQEMRVSTFPTLYGERAVVRLFGAQGRYERLDDLGMPDDVLTGLKQLLAETSGAIVVTGPAGSGKTTTLYACLREIASESNNTRSLVSIEDPIEVAVPGVAQSQVNAGAGLDLATGLRFLMRQDPEVIMVGEIRDRATAEAAFQASLTGHLLLSTFHAGSAAAAISRLSEMGIEPYALRSGVLAILSQRLLRRLCSCATESERVDDRLGLPVEKARLPAGCAECRFTGYRGRLLVVEMLVPASTQLGRAILSRSDSARLEELALASGMISQYERACQAVQSGLTSPAEVRRVFGLAKPAGSGYS